jgi:HEAT repeat protein
MSDFMAMLQTRLLRVALIFGITFGPIVVIGIVVIIGRGVGLLPKPHQVTVDELLPQLKNSYQARAAMKQLVFLKPDAAHQDEVAQALVKLLDDPDAGVREDAARTLAIWGRPEDAPAVAKLLQAPEAHLHRAAMPTLGKLKGPEAADALVNQFRIPLERFDAARIIMNEFGSDAEPALLKYLDDPDSNVRAECLGVLKVVGTRQSIPALTTASQGSNQFEAWAAQDALRAVQSR